MHALDSHTGNSETSIDSKERQENWERALVLARNAFDLSTEYGIPPVPKAYEVCYAYASGQNELVTQRIDSVINAGGILNLELVDQIHGELLSSSRRDEIRRRKDKLKFQSVMDETLSQLKWNGSRLNGFAHLLGQTSSALSSHENPNRICRAIERLIIEIDRVQSETEELIASLHHQESEIEEISGSEDAPISGDGRDILTDLRNRSSFEAALAIETASANGENPDLCVVLADLDFFSRLNDFYGQSIGDAVLKYFASLLLENLKGQDTVARFTGDRFAIILPRTHLKDATGLIERIRKLLATSKLATTANQQPLGQITASFGIALLRRGENGQDLVSRAETQLFQAKTAGRNRVMAEG